MTAGNFADFRLASYNIRKAVGTDWRRDPERIGSVIATLDADLVVLQEADKRLGQRPTALPRTLILERTGLLAADVGQSGVSLGWHGIALLVRPGIEMEKIRCVDLPGMEPRGAVVADMRRDGHRLRLVGVHLGLLRRARRQQLSHLTSVLGHLPPAPTVIAGDFNEWSQSVGLGRLAGGFSIHAPGLSFHASRPIAALDRIATNAGVVLRDMGVHRDHVSSRASDHLPVWAHLRVSAEQGQPDPDRQDRQARGNQDA